MPLAEPAKRPLGPAMHALIAPLASTWPMAALEHCEKLEQLRALYNGVNIHCAEAVEPVPAGVDTAQDLARVCAVFNNA